MEKFFRVIIIFLGLCLLAFMITLLVKPGLFNNSNQDNVIESPMPDDTEQPGTETEEPGTDTEEPGTDTEEPAGPKVYEGFTFDGNTLVSYTGSETDIVIPSSYSINEDGQFIEGEDYEVTSIVEGTTSGTSAFAQSKSTIKSIFIPDTITSLGFYAFYGMENLETVVLPLH